MTRLATHKDGRVDWPDQGHNSGKFNLEKQMEGGYIYVCFHFEVRCLIGSVPDKAENGWETLAVFQVGDVEGQG